MSLFDKPFFGIKSQNRAYNTAFALYTVSALSLDNYIPDCCGFTNSSAMESLICEELCRLFCHSSTI